MTSLCDQHLDMIAEGAQQLPAHAREQYAKDVADLLRGLFRPTSDDIVQAIGMAHDLFRRRA